MSIVITTKPLQGKHNKGVCVNIVVCRLNLPTFGLHEACIISNFDRPEAVWFEIVAFVQKKHLMS